MQKEYTDDHRIVNSIDYAKPDSDIHVHINSHDIRVKHSNDIRVHDCDIFFNFNCDIITVFNSNFVFDVYSIIDAVRNSIVICDVHGFVDCDLVRDDHAGHNLSDNHGIKYRVDYCHINRDFNSCSRCHHMRSYWVGKLLEGRHRRLAKQLYQPQA